MTCVGRFHSKQVLRYSKLTKQLSQGLNHEPNMSLLALSSVYIITIQFGFKIALHVQTLQ